ncbi:MAG: anhydro-N-acetylmuramic acid kinase, partial [Bacteroidia bacterium]|nr:anhydro-N-acetylmuramic acid kinase [Bacteroidia bacterium]
MIKDTYNVLGVMSGTSLDGIDLALCKFEKKQRWSYTIVKSNTISYSPIWQNYLQDLVNKDLEALKVIDEKYTRYLGEAIQNFISEHDIANIDFISSHGHTALHQPEKGLTYQIGNLSSLANFTKLTVVCDFRTQDVDFGGQGAPLVPIGDLYLFSDYDYCINLGGFANISFQNENERMAYDICPVNIVLNSYVQKFNLEYDESGKIAASGSLNTALLNDLNQLDYYKKSYPKSLGLEWVNNVFTKVIGRYEISNKDILRTLVEHIVIQISSSVKKSNSKILI